jgi:archaeal cell division control protein 6
MKLKPGQTLFRDESVFEPSYMPEDFLFRDNQMHAMMSCLKPALRGSKPSNAFIFGRPATGKTTATKLVFSEMQGHVSKALAVHINCHIYNSEYRILGEIHRKIFGFVPPESGLSVTALYDKIFSRLEKEKKVLIIALDDMDFSDAKLANSILYDMMRVHEVYPGVKTAIWCISVRNEMHKLEDKVRSTLLTHTIEFLPYKKEEMKEILKRRAIAGLFPDVAGDMMLEKIAGFASDLRHGIELLKKSAMLSEEEGSVKIAEKHVQAAAKSMELPLSSSMADDEEILLDMLKRKSMESGALYEEYKKITGASYSTFYRTLQKMKEKKMVVIENITKGQGRSSRIKLK